MKTFLAWLLLCGTAAAQVAPIPADNISVDNQTIVNRSHQLATSSPDNTFTSGHSIASTDMGGQVNMNGSSLTVTIPAISSTVLAAGMSVTINNFNSSALTISTTPTINGFSGTSIPQYGGINCVSNGTSLDCVGLGVLANQGLLNVAQTWSAAQTFTEVIGGINTQSGTTYTLAATDCGKVVLFTSGSAITLTTLNSLPAGCSIAVEQGGAGQITVSPGSSATQHSAHSYTKTFGQYAILGLFVDTNSGSNADFIISGDGA